MSAKKDWGTPPKYVSAVRTALGGTIHLDPCSNAYSVVSAITEYRLPATDGLLASWDFPTIFVNPPYGSDPERGTSIRHWLERCANAHERHGAQVIALIPVATNTRHWKESVFRRARAVCFLADTRLRFLEAGQDLGKGAPMACAMAYWGDDPTLFATSFVHYGAVLDLSRETGMLPQV